ncbi:hypothetical protein AVEN_150542-1 [Araneus ventricosus]|uniref:Uncharacterized protein n=1 Tax=Araneus ventricosus TaxID=182803 RepID=A0A4Y2E4A3_ARAVE|nr:hypothetical protein AVEN_150542-1 [Araneus ventricosus]
MIYQALFKKCSLPGRNLGTTKSSGTCRSPIILVDNQANIQSAAKPKSRNTIARKIYKLVHLHTHIRVTCIKVSVGYIGNEDWLRRQQKLKTFPKHHSS